MQRIDWRTVTISSILFLLKNIDADNISNARILNKGTDTNILMHLDMTSDQYNLLNVLYYVGWPLVSLFLPVSFIGNCRSRTLCSRPPQTC